MPPDKNVDIGKKIIWVWIQISGTKSKKCHFRWNYVKDYIWNRYQLFGFLTSFSSIITLWVDVHEIHWTDMFDVMSVFFHGILPGQESIGWLAHVLQARLWREKRTRTKWMLAIHVHPPSTTRWDQRLTTIKQWVIANYLCNGVNPLPSSASIFAPCFTNILVISRLPWLQARWIGEEKSAWNVWKPGIENRFPEPGLSSANT